jgi:hypothetical protein
LSTNLHHNFHSGKGEQKIATAFVRMYLTICFITVDIYNVGYAASAHKKNDIFSAGKRRPQSKASVSGNGRDESALRQVYIMKEGEIVRSTLFA